MKVKKLILVIILFCVSLGVIGCNNSPLDEAKAYVINGLKTEVTSDLFFITEYKGVTITYNSSNPNVITNEGLVTRQANDEIVNIEILFTYQDIVYTYNYMAIVRALEKKDPQEVINEAKNYVSSLIPTDVLDDLEFVNEYLGVTITYSSNKTDVLSNTGQVVKQTTDVEVILTINFEYLGTTDSYIIYITVCAKEKELEDFLDDIKRDVEAKLGIVNNVVTKDLMLTTSSLYSSTIKWTSSNEAIISLNGSVAKDIDNEKVLLTYTINYQDKDYGPYELNLTVITNRIGYYSSITESSGNSLKLQLRTLITSTHKKILSYNDLKVYTAKTDVDPNNPNNIILFYSRKSVSSKWDGGNTWNREHVWPQSKSWFTTSGAGADIHHLRPTNPTINSSRGNKPYGETTNGSMFEPNDEVKGDVARILFYLLVRYQESDSYSITKAASSMRMLLEWNRLDPVDNLEITRNEEAAKIQGNRNPFIDNYLYAEMIWASARNMNNDVIEPIVEIITIEYFVILNDIKEYQL